MQKTHNAKILSVYITRIRLTELRSE